MTPTCNNAFQFLPLSPQPRMTMTPNLPQSTTPSRRSTSPLKQPTPKYNTTPHKASRLISSRKSPKKVLFQTAEPVSFTPQRTKQPPRAWERRPATPFVPRDEKQKIWKRVPLGELGIDVNQPVGVSRREQEKSKDYTRVVKKLKTGHDDVDIDDKENHAIGVKTAIEETALKRPCLRGGDFISMKMEEDEILGSPKKKFRPVFQDDSSGEATFLMLETEGSMDDLEEDAEDGQDGTNATISEVRTSQMSHTLLSGSLQQIPLNRSHAGANNSEVVATATVLADDAYAEGHDREIELELDDPKTHEIDDIVTGDNCDQEEVLMSTRIDEHTGCIAYAASNDVPVPHQASDEVEEPRSSSPPTVLAENVIVDELEFAELPSKQPSAGAEGDFGVDHNAEQETQGRSANKPTSKRISDGETAFLQDFLLRTKAQKIARENEVNNRALMDNPLAHCEPERVEKNDTQGPNNPGEEPASASLENIPSNPIYRASPSLSSNTSNEVISSPLRRSRRANVTTLPRSSTLPNAIQLKRASGTEFIFTANKTPSTANVALVTRTNTKQNKGSALNVRARLEQLGDAKATAENPAADQEEFEIVDTNRAATKRKRSKLDNGRKTKKALRWNDDNLVSYQEFRNEVWEEDISDSSQESVNPTPREDVSSNGSTRIKLTMSLPSHNNTNKTKCHDSTLEDDNSPSMPAPSRPECQDGNNANSSQNKLRRVRHGIAGSVNGTPGPKTRSKRSILESDLIEATDLENTEVKLDETLQESAAATVAMNNLADGTVRNSNSTIAAVPATRRSRIAVPSTRHGHGHGSAATGKAARLLRNATSSENVRTAEEKNSDLLGKRRLRVRD